MTTSRFQKIAIMAAASTIGLPLAIGAVTIGIKLSSYGILPVITMIVIWAAAAALIFMELSKEREETP